MMAQSLLDGYIMDVCLLTNALISNLSGLPAAAAPAGALSPGLGLSEGAGNADGTESIASDNTPIGVPSQPVQNKPAKDFGQMLEEQMQTVTPLVQSYPVPTDVPNDLSATSDSPVPQAADLPQQESMVQGLQVLTQVLCSSVPSVPVHLTTGQSEQMVLQSPSVMPELADGLAELPGQTQSNVIQSAQNNMVAALDTQSAEGVQPEPKPTQKDAITGDLGTQPEAKNAAFESESPVDGDSAAIEQGETPDPVRQTSVNARPESQAESGVIKAASPGAQPVPQEDGPKISGSGFDRPSSDGSINRQANAVSERPDSSATGASPGETTPLADSFTQKVNIAQSETPTAHAKGSNTQTRNGGGGSGEFEQAVSVESLQNVRVENPSNAAQPIKSPGNPAPSDAYSTVGDQIRESIRSSMGRPEREITIRLNPPELGRVVIKFHQQEDQITGILEVSRSQTRAQVQQELPGIARDLLELGVQVKRLDVVMAGEREQQTLSGWSAMPQQNGWGSQQGATSHNPNAPYASAGELIGEDGEYTGFAGRGRSYVTEKSIDIFA